MRTYEQKKPNSKLCRSLDRTGCSRESGGDWNGRSHLHCNKRTERSGPNKQPRAHKCDGNIIKFWVLGNAKKACGYWVCYYRIFKRKGCSQISNSLLKRLLFDNSLDLFIVFLSDYLLWMQCLIQSQPKTCTKQDEQTEKRSNCFGAPSTPTGYPSSAKRSMRSIA